MNASDIIGYAFNGAEYCVSCAYAARRSWNAKCECERSERDENGLCASNCHGYGPNPIFGDSEDAGSCDTCGEALIEPWEEEINESEPEAEDAEETAEGV